MVSQRKACKKVPRQGFRRSSRLSSLNSRPKLDIVIEKSLPKTQPVDNGYNLRTQSTSASESKLSTSRKSQDGRPKGRQPKMKSSINLTRKGVSQSSAADCDRELRSSRTSRAKSLPEYSPPTDENNNSQKPHNQFSTEIESSLGNDRQELPELPVQGFLEKLSLSSTIDDTESPPPPLTACSFPKRADSSPFENYLSRASVKNVKPSLQEQKRYPTKNSKLTLTQNDDTKKKVKKESYHAERPSDISRKSKKVRRPPKLLRIKNLKKEVEESEENEPWVDELCSQFEICDFSSTPRYFAKDEKPSLSDCIPKLRTRNVLSQKLIELNAEKDGKVKKPLPNLIPIIFTQDIGATFPDEIIRNGPPESMGSEEHLDIGNILKSITHIYYRVPYYVPYEENWYEGFDRWNQGE